MLLLSVHLVIELPCLYECEYFFLIFICFCRCEIDRSLAIIAMYMDWYYHLLFIVIFVAIIIIIVGIVWLVYIDCYYHLLNNMNYKTK